MTALHYFHNRPFGPMLREVSNLLEEGVRSPSKATLMPAMIIESERAYVLRLEAPGVSKEDLTIQVDEKQLRVSGKKKIENGGEDDKVRVLLNELGSVSFSRSFRVTEEVDRDSIEASFENGLLTLILPKVVKLPPRDINIVSGISKDKAFDAGASGELKS